MRGGKGEYLQAFLFGSPCECADVRRYVEWEDYPEKKEKAHKILTSQSFPPDTEFQLTDIPATNPVLSGVRWKMWHHALGGELDSAPDDS